ncbi:MAG: M48 family metallopeptidase [Devosia nanyangense]|uniref:M48 family metallopeptidase n=1 Tax=Devosia nanyangense TaxID=1228055 RepID=A0A933L0S8_9HYPH|nr:M48 family metallopeptidase [Devosia nanyangense]
MQFTARYQDGLIAETRDVRAVIDLAADPVALAIVDPQSREEIDRWPAAQTYLLHTRAMELRIGSRTRPAGARLAVSGIEEMRNALAVLPSLAKQQRRDGWAQVRLLTLATAALASVIVAYLFGVPLLADRLVELVPPGWETKIGDTAAAQIERSLTDGEGFVLCEPDRNSVANRAIARFADAAFDGLGSPFRPEVAVVRTDIPNAFALPGGRAYYFSALLQASRTPDEFAGVLAHELGHVYYRHGMESLIASSATGLLVGFVLGDMTGLSVAGIIGSTLIDNRFSRRAETQADTFAAETARRLGFQPSGLIDLLERVAKDDEFSKALSLFSSHPLTEERRRALEALSTPIADAKPAFTAAEWSAIRDMCPPPPPPPLPKPVTPGAPAP